MKYAGRIAILFAIFLGALYFFGSNMDEVMFGAVKTATMEEAELPTVELVSDGGRANWLYGYVSPVDMYSIRENMVAVEADGVVELLITENETDVRKLYYEVCSVDDHETIATGTVNALEREDGKKKGRIKITSEMDSGEEYAVEVVLVDSESRRIYYYFRIKYYEDSCFGEKVAFMRNITNWTLEKDHNGIIPYLESTYRGEGSSYAFIDIKDSYYMVCWGNLEPKLLTEPRLNISEVYSNIAVGTMEYLVELETDTGVEQYYVTEKFRVIVTSTATHLLNYERTLESVFDAGLASLSRNQFKLGITNETDMEFLTNSDNSLTAFVRNKELWQYNMAENKLSRVFTLRKANEAEDGLSCEQYDIRVLKLYENGDISFMVYGYMGKGDYEGRTGIWLYRYYRSEERVEEVLYMPVSETYQKIKEELGSFSYMNDYDVFYFMAYRTIYSYSLITKELKVLSDNALASSVVFFQDSGYVAWQEDYSRLYLLNMETGEQKEIAASDGEFIRIFGKFNGNIVCGYGRQSDCGVLGDGSPVYPIHTLKILTTELQEQKTYQKNGFYVVGAEFLDSSICLKRMTKTLSGGFADAADDYILDNTAAEKKPITLEKRITALMLVQYYIALPSTYQMKEIPVPEEIPYTIITEDLTVRVDKLENTAEEYMVYSFGSIIAIGEDCAELIKLADKSDIVGTVVNEDGRVVWERGVKFSAYYLNERNGTPIKESGLTSRQEAVRMLAEYMRDVVNVKEFTQGQSVKEFLEQRSDKRVLNLKGITLDEALYYVYKGAPVFAMTSETEAVVITGYSTSSIRVYDPSLGKSKVVSISEAEEMFLKAGNIFLSYLE